MAGRPPPLAAVGGSRSAPEPTRRTSGGALDAVARRTPTAPDALSRRVPDTPDVLLGRRTAGAPGAALRPPPLSGGGGGWDAARSSERVERFVSRARRLFHDETPFASIPLSKWYLPRLCWVLALTYAATVIVLISLPTFIWWSGSYNSIDEVVDTFRLARDGYHETFKEATGMLAGDIQLQLTQHVVNKLQHYLEWPVRVLNMTTETQSRGVPIFRGRDVTYNLQVMWTLFRFTYPELSYLWQADRTGLFAGYARLNRTSYQAEYRPPDNLAESAIICPRICPPVWELKSGQKGNYYVDSETGRFGPAWFSRPYATRQRAWYKGAVKAKGSIASTRPYLFSSKVDIGIDYSVLLPDEHGTIFGASITLKLLTDFLVEAQRSMLGGMRQRKQERVTFIVDRYGYMVASSRGLETVLGPDANGTLHQMPWTEVNDSLIRVCTDLPQLWGRTHEKGSEICKSDHGKFLWLYAYQGLSFGELDWIIISVVRLDTWLQPVDTLFEIIENKLTEDIVRLRGCLSENLIHTVFMCAFVVLLVGLPVIACLAHTITRPLQLICRDMKSIAKLEFLAHAQGESTSSSEGETGSEWSESENSPRSSRGRGRRRSRYMRTFAIFKQPALPIKEVAQMRDAFAAMASGLKSFSRYVDPHVMESLIQSRQQATLHVQSTTVTIFFSDIANFTTIAESLQPAVFMELLSEYLDVMSIIIMRNQGTVGEFIGDAIMAWWNAPVDLGEGHTRIALRTALEQQLRLEALRKKWCSNRLPEVHARMGLVRGTVLAGNIGCSQRMKYGLVGDSVNLASRLEGLCKRYGVSILIDGDTEAAPGVREAFYCRPLDLVVVKGRTGTTELFELVANRSGQQEELNEASEETVETVLTVDEEEHAAFVHDYAAILAMYRQGHFRGAVVALEDYRQRWPADKPALMLHQKCEQYLASPPGEGWSPVERLTEK